MKGELECSFQRIPYWLFLFQENEEEKSKPAKISKQDDKPVKKKRGRPKGAVSKDKVKKIERKKRKPDLARKVLRSNVGIIYSLVLSQFITPNLLSIALILIPLF